jgi:hypothetical protein
MNLFKQSEQHHHQWHLGRTIYDVLAYGAVGDGRTNDTQAFFTAWNLACATANGVLHAPVAYTFLVYHGWCLSTSLTSPSVALAPSTGKEKIGGRVRKPKPWFVWK